MNTLRCALTSALACLAAAMLSACHVDGPPTDVLSPSACEAAGGEVIGDPGDGSVHQEGCPDSREFLGSVSIGIEGGVCCGPAPALSLAECEAEGGEAIADPGDGSTYRDGCPDGRTLLGTLGIELGDEGGICCASVAMGIQGSGHGAN